MSDLLCGADGHAAEPDGGPQPPHAAPAYRGAAENVRRQQGLLSGNQKHHCPTGGKADSIQGGITLAAQTIDSGKATEVLAELVKLTNV